MVGRQSSRQSTSGQSQPSVSMPTLQSTLILPRLKSSSLDWLSALSRLESTTPASMPAWRKRAASMAAWVMVQQKATQRRRPPACSRKALTALSSSRGRLMSLASWVSL